MARFIAKKVAKRKNPIIFLKVSGFKELFFIFDPIMRNKFDTRFNNHSYFNKILSAAQLIMNNPLQYESKKPWWKVLIINKLP